MTEGEEARGETVRSLVTVNLAHMRYIQEYVGLVVQGTFGTKTQKLFRKTAVELAALADPPAAETCQGTFCGDFRGD